MTKKLFNVYKDLKSFVENPTNDFYHIVEYLYGYVSPTTIGRFLSYKWVFIEWLERFGCSDKLIYNLRNLNALMKYYDIVFTNKCIEIIWNKGLVVYPYGSVRTLDECICAIHPKAFELYIQHVDEFNVKETTLENLKNYKDRGLLLYYEGYRLYYAYEGAKQEDLFDFAEKCLCIVNVLDKDIVIGSANSLPLTCISNFDTQDELIYHLYGDDVISYLKCSKLDYKKLNDNLLSLYIQLKNNKNLRFRTKLINGKVYVSEYEKH